MKGIILSIVCFMLFVAATIILLHLRRWEKPYKAFLAVYSAIIPLYCLLYYLLPVDMYFLPSSLIEQCGIVDFFYGIVVYSLVFHSFWDFVYAGPMGFSAGLMVEIYNVGDRGISAEGLHSYFKRAGGTDSIYSRRLPNLVQGGYASIKGDCVYLTVKGRSIATVVSLLKSFFCASEGG